MLSLDHCFAVLGMLVELNLKQEPILKQTDIIDEVEDQLIP